MKTKLTEMHTWSPILAVDYFHSQWNPNTCITWLNREAGYATVHTSLQKEYIPILFTFEWVFLRVHEQENRNVLNVLFLIVRELVLVNPNNALQECCNP